MLHSQIKKNVKLSTNCKLVSHNLDINRFLKLDYNQYFERITMFEIYFESNYQKKISRNISE